MSLFLSLSLTRLGVGARRRSCSRCPRLESASATFRQRRWKRKDALAWSHDKVANVCARRDFLSLSLSLAHAFSHSRVSPRASPRRACATRGNIYLYIILGDTRAGSNNFFRNQLADATTGKVSMGSSFLAGARRRFFVFHEVSPRSLSSSFHSLFDESWDTMESVFLKPAAVVPRTRRVRARLSRWAPSLETTHLRFVSKFNARKILSNRFRHVRGRVRGHVGRDAAGDDQDQTHQLEHGFPGGRALPPQDRGPRGRLLGLGADTLRRLERVHLE